MRLLYGQILAVLLAATSAVADPPKVDPQPVVTIDQRIVELDALVKEDQALENLYKLKKTDIAKRKAILAIDLKAKHKAITDKLTKAGILGPLPKPPAPKPKPVDPKPVDPKPVDPPAPVPAKTLRIIFAVESGDNPTTAQSGVIYGLEVENWCLKNCTGGKDGFARRDKDNPTIAGKDLSDIWQAARPTITKTPAAIVEKNTHIEIIALEDTPEKMIAVFNEYLQGKRGK